MLVRVALLSSIDSLAGDERSLRAFARIGGRTIIQRQLDFALAMGCEQIACHSDGLHPDLIDLQHLAENAGARLQVIRDVRPLSGIVKAADELLVIADGLAFDEAVLVDRLSGEKGVVTLAADKAVPAGFERLDRDSAWAGIMLTSGALVEQLADLPADIDLQSSLLRIALQSGTKTVELADSALPNFEVMMVDDEQSLRSFEGNWLGTAAEPVSFVAPVHAAADRAALAIITRHHNPNSAARVGVGLGFVLLLTALAVGYFGYSAAGFAIAALAAFAVRFGQAILVIVNTRKPLSQASTILAKIPTIALDISLVILVLLSVPRVAQTSSFFAVLMLVGLLRLTAAPRGFSQADIFQQLLEDRGVLAILLGIALVTGKLVLGIQVLAGILMVLLVVQTYSPRLTRA